MNKLISKERVRCCVVGLALSLTLILASGCATQQVPPYQSSIINQTALARLPQAARFHVDEAISAPADTRAQVRGLRIAAPGEQPWSVYLANALRVELTTSGNYDTAAPTAIEATLIEVNVGDGKADATAHFIVRNAGEIPYDKTLHAHAAWESHFIGVLAAQDGLMQASAILQALIGQLFRDPEFVKSV